MGLLSLFHGGNVIVVNAGRFGSKNAKILDYTVGFRLIEDKNIWPLPKSTICHVGAAFGPRKNGGSKGYYDYHRGIDITGAIGDPIVSVYDGVVTGVYNWSGGGLTVAIRHNLPQLVKFHPDKPSTDVFYTLYSHMGHIGVTWGDEVKAGQNIGEIGMTGRTNAPHLHFELRLQVFCSLENALKSTAFECNKVQIDPHINPLILFKHLSCAEDVGNEILVPKFYQMQKLNQTHDGIIRVRTEDADAGMIFFGFYSVESTRTIPRTSHELDLNLRTGFDATSLEALDTPDTTKPWLDPVSFGSRSDTWRMDLVIPHEFVRYKNAGETFRVLVRDVWGFEYTYDFGVLMESWTARDGSNTEGSLRGRPINNNNNNEGATDSDSTAVDTTPETKTSPTPAPPPSPTPPSPTPPSPTPPSGGPSRGRFWWST